MKLNGTKGVLTDNSKFYLDLVTVSIQHSDPDATIEVSEKYNCIDTIIKPSDPAFKQDIIDNLLASHKFFKLRIIFSKSLAQQKIISYSLYFEE